ncbi:MAG TPA: EamA family transporter [Candidatus Methylomirabilis sp.]|nr:EamA family transporter [Candidatus Methylomirabilis sp.]
MLIGLLLTALASISWGTTGATMTLLSRTNDIGPMLVGWARLAVAAPCLVLAATLTSLVRSDRRVTTPRQAPSSTWTARQSISYVVPGLAMAAYQVCYFRAVTLSGVAVTALLAIGTAPLLIAVLAGLLLRERLSAIARISLALAVAGTALLVVGPRGLGQSSGRFGLGALLALGAGASYAVYAVATKGIFSRAAPLPVAAITFSLAAIFLTPTLLGQRAPFSSVAAHWPLLLYLGVGPTAVAYVLFTEGLRRVPATAAGIVSLIEPLTATLLGVMLFGESLGALGVGGAILLLVSFGLLAAGDRVRLAERRRRHRAADGPPRRPGIGSHGPPEPSVPRQAPEAINRPRDSRRD